MKTRTALFICLALLGSALNALTIICFTINESVDDPSISIPFDREIYFTIENSNYHMNMVEDMVMLPAIQCERMPVMSMGTAVLKCGNQEVVLDLANKRGTLMGGHSVANQGFVCREKDNVAMHINTHMPKF